MLKNYFKIAWRNLFRNRSYALMNIMGLAIAMAAVALVALWIQDEMSYDRFYSTTDRLYQVYSKDDFDGKSEIWGSTPGLLVDAIKSDFPEVEDAVRVMGDSELLTVGEKRLNTEGAITDSDFLGVFGLPTISGNAATALTNSKGIVITKTLGENLFGTEQPLGKTIRVNNSEDREITAVIEDFPRNSRFYEISYFLPYDFLIQQWGNEWGRSWTANNFVTYVLVKEDVDFGKLNSKIKNTIPTHTAGSGDLVSTEIVLHPASKWRLYSKRENGELVAGEISHVWQMGRVALFLLLIACINFMNLSTARSEKRAKEVGIRKVAGASRRSLIFQFLGESVLLASLSGVIAFVLALACLPSFNLILDKQLAFQIGNWTFWSFSLGFILFTGLLAGSYPAFFLSSFKPVKVLKGTFKTSRFKVFNLRKILVVVQFSLAILLIISTIITRQQTEYAQNRDKGFDENNLVYITINDEMKAHFQVIKRELLDEGIATSVTQSLGHMAKISSDGWGFSWDGSTEKDKKQDFIWLSSDADFVKTMGVQLVAGRDIDAYNYPTDSTAILLNEKAVQTMGLKNPIGAIIRNGLDQWHVVGVVKDFIMGSPYQSIDPLMVQGPVSGFNYINIRLNPNNSVSANLKKMEVIFKKNNPLFPFEYFFTDEAYGRKFKTEQTIGELGGVFSGLTILIACLGLFALAAYTTEARRKEIGIRKVLGASVYVVAFMVSKDFLKLVVISFIIASPLAWLHMSEWLGDYQYRISIEWWVFARVGVAAIFIALITVGFQAIKAAIANPVKSLRTE